MKPVVVAVSPKEQLHRYRRLLDAMGDLFSIQFEHRGEENFAGCAAVLLLGGTRADALRVAGSGLPCVTFIKEQPVAVTAANASLSFGPIQYLPQCLRGRTFADESITFVRPLNAESGDEVAARKGEHVVWIHRDLGNASFDLMALDPPVLTETEYPYQFFQRDNCMRLLPLLRVLRRISRWKKPQLRASFMFDDPNLHWKSYGYIQFAELARHASEYNYHACFATVPFDAWYVHPATAALFQANKSRLSLLVHGNNHTKAELCRTYVEGRPRALMAQALQRILWLEKRSGIEVSHVMAAPHGGCSPEMAATLLQVGFEAACISRWSLMRHNPDVKWYPSFGLNLAEFLGGAFPIIPRFKLAKEREMDIYLAALLEKPIVLVGHHDDLSEGLSILAEFAGWINSVGDVKWMDMKSIARSNFLTQSDGDTLHIRMYSRRISIDVPANINNLVIEGAWLRSQANEILRLRRTQEGFQTVDARGAEAFFVTPEHLEIISGAPAAVDPRHVRPPHTPLWAVARRGFCEIRDRLKPTLDDFRKPR